MLPELLRFSSSSHLLRQIPEDVQAFHKQKVVVKKVVEKTTTSKEVVEDIWAGWGMRQTGGSLIEALENGGKGLDLGALGL